MIVAREVWWMAVLLTLAWLIGDARPQIAAARKLMQAQAVQAKRPERWRDVGTWALRAGWSLAVLMSLAWLVWAERVAA